MAQLFPVSKQTYKLFYSLRDFYFIRIQNLQFNYVSQVVIEHHVTDEKMLYKVDTIGLRRSNSLYAWPIFNFTDFLSLMVTEILIVCKVLLTTPYSTARMGSSDDRQNLCSKFFLINIGMLWLPYRSYCFCHTVFAIFILKIDGTNIMVVCRKNIR